MDNQPEVSRRPIEPIVSKPKPVPQTLKDTEETTQESSLTQSINRDLSLALSAVRDEIREAKKVSSIKWNNKEGKAKIVAEIDSLIAQAMTLSPKDMVVKTHEILSKARTQSIIEKDQIVPLVSLYMVNPPDAKKIRDAAVSIIRASNGSTQMHEIFYSRNANTIDARIAKFTSAEKDTLGKELNKLTSKMDHNLNKIAEKEWSVNSVEIKKQNPSMDLATFTKEYKENYRKYVQSDLERKLAIKLIGDVEFKKQDATLWNQYNSAVDPLDEWETFSDETATAAANFVVYDLTSMLISGGVAGLIGRGAVLATR